MSLLKKENDNESGNKCDFGQDAEILNPFVHKLALENTFDKFKTAVFTVLLLPIRVLLICVLLLIAWALANIGLYGVTMNDLQTKPMTGWRRKAQSLTSMSMRGMFMAGSFHKIKIIGKPVSTNEAPIVTVAPHSSFFDSIVPISVGAVPACVLAKAETSSLPFFGSHLPHCLIINISNGSLKYLISMVGRWSYIVGGMAITIKGCQADRKDAAILVIAPHSTFLDSVIVYVTKMSTVIVRYESMDNYAGKLINFTQPIYVWREDPNSRQNTIKSIIERANSKLDWPQIIIFPEGTCTNRSCLITFKPGAFYPGVPVQPVCIRYPNKLDTVTWTWEGPGVLKLLWLTLTQINSCCEIEFLPVYQPNEEEKRNPKLYANNVRKVMADALHIPTSDYTYDDCRMMTRAKELNIPHAVDIVEIEKLRKKLSLNQRNIEDIPSEAMNYELSLIEFSEKLKIPIKDPSTKLLFSLFTKTNSECIDFREYLLCATFIDKCNVPVIELLESISKIYEIKDNSSSLGLLNAKGLYKVLQHIMPISSDEFTALFTQLDRENQKLIKFSDLKDWLSSKPENSNLFDTGDSSKNTKS